MLLVLGLCGRDGLSAGAEHARMTASSLVFAENALPGSPAGVLPNTAAGAIEGYASEVSAGPGDTLHFHVSTAGAAPYRVEIYRLGWYGGAGARLVGCTPTCTGVRAGQTFAVPAPRADGLVQAAWPVTDTFTLPPDSVSGYYRVRFLLAGGQASNTFVIVRAPPGGRSAILVQVPVSTWQAYNSWGGRSLYDIAGTAARANRVSFDRPYAWSAPGNQSPMGREYSFVLFLEQSGYDVSYQTDLDTDRDPTSLLGHRLVISLGHGEYWTQTMRDAFTAARDAGVNLAFMGANDVYWRIRYEDGGRTIVDYKSGDDSVRGSPLQTGYFRVLDSSECKLIGIQHQGGELDWPAGDYGIVAASLSNPWFAGTGFDPASVLRGLVGVETDSIPSWDHGASCGHRLTVFFHREGGGDQLGNADATAYTAPSGATVFAAGSKRFVWGLADAPAASGRAQGLVDPRLQRFVHNMLDDLAGMNVADLRVALTPLPWRRGRAFVEISVTNRGPDPADPAVLDVTLPAGATFVRVASTQLRCTRQPLQCTTGPLPPGTSVRGTFALRLPRRGSYTIRAHVATHNDDEPNPSGATQALALPPR
jgi:N,N-dimethylformamidase beta subunit-like protein/uncharacterized protein DUF11